MRIYVTQWNADHPADVDGFAVKLQEKDFLDFGSKWTKVDKKEAFDAGWVITGEWSDGEDTEKVFAVQLTKMKTLCRGYVKAKAKNQAASHADGIAACKGAKL